MTRVAIVPVAILTAMVLTGPLSAAKTLLYGQGPANTFRPVGGPHLDVLKDPHGRLHFEQVLGAPFRPASARVPNFGFTRAVYWIRFRIRNASEEPQLLVRISYPLLDRIEFYATAAGRGQTVYKFGDRHPFARRPLTHRAFLIPIRIRPGNTETFYIRFESQGTQQFPVDIGTAEAQRLHDRSEQMALGLYYGIIVVLSLYNLILFFLVRDWSYLYYLLYISGYGVIQLILNGLAFEYFWPNAPGWANVSLPLFIGWTFFWSTLFARVFLFTRGTARRMDRVLNALMLSFLGLMLLSVTAPYNFNIILSAFLVLLFSGVVLFSALASYRSGFRPARYFLIAWLLLLVGVAIYALKGLGYLPANFFTEYGLQIGSAAEMSLLSLGLADRINVLAGEREAARRQALETQKLQKETQLQAARLEIELLKRNIEPHFLLNSINAVMVWLSEDPGSAGRLLGSLADELRLLLAMTGQRTVSIHDEIRICRAHLEVMSLRHDKQFELQTVGVPEPPPTGTEPGEYEQIPPLIFHTLIENGLSHGYRNRERGKFTLTQAEDSTTITFELENDGDSTPGAARGGVGLSYVRTRLEEVFPKRWDLSGGPGPKGGWVNRLRINKVRAAKRKKKSP